MQPRSAHSHVAHSSRGFIYRLSSSTAARARVVAFGASMCAISLGLSARANGPPHDAPSALDSEPSDDVEANRWAYDGDRKASETPSDGAAIDPDESETPSPEGEYVTECLEPIDGVCGTIEDARSAIISRIGTPDSCELLPEVLPDGPDADGQCCYRFELQCDEIGGGNDGVAGPAFGCG